MNKRKANNSFLLKNQALDYLDLPILRKQVKTNIKIKQH